MNNCIECFYGPHAACTKPRATNCPCEERNDLLTKMHRAIIKYGCDALADDLKAGKVKYDEAWKLLTEMERVAPVVE